MNTQTIKVMNAMLAMQRYSWEHGLAAQALLEIGEKDWLVLLMREAVHRQVDDGRTAVIGSFRAVTDPCANGEPLGHAYQITNDDLFKTSYEKLVDWAINKAPRNQEGIIYHLEERPEFWVDTLYMLPPFLAYAGYFKEAIRQINGYWQYLYNDEAGLLSHMWHDGRKAFVRKDFWGVGNGWAMAGLCRVIDFLPDTMIQERQNLQKKAKMLIDASMKFQRNDGFFHDVINDPTTFTDTNFAQMIAYTIYRGIKSGWLNSHYKETADRIRSAADNKIDDYGYVHDVCGAPDFLRSGYAVDGQAFHIMMQAAAEKLDQ